MGLLSWLRGRRRSPESLIKTRYEDPKLAETERNAAADIAAVEEDDKYFDPHGPSHQPGD